MTDFFLIYCHRTYRKTYRQEALLQLFTKPSHADTQSRLETDFICPQPDGRTEYMTVPFHRNAHSILISLQRSHTLHIPNEPHDPYEFQPRKGCLNKHHPYNPRTTSLLI